MSITMEDPIGSYWAMKSRKDMLAEIVYLKQFESQLAECYRLTGADPDGNEDWRLAPRAVEEVKRLREEGDESADRIEALEDALRRIRDFPSAAGSSYKLSGVYKIAEEAMGAKP